MNNDLNYLASDFVVISQANSSPMNSTTASEEFLEKHDETLKVLEVKNEIFPSSGSTDKPLVVIVDQQQVAALEAQSTPSSKDGWTSWLFNGTANLVSGIWSSKKPEEIADMEEGTSSTGIYHIYGSSNDEEEIVIPTDLHPTLQKFADFVKENKEFKLFKTFEEQKGIQEASDFLFYETSSSRKTQLLKEVIDTLPVTDKEKLKNLISICHDILSLPKEENNLSIKDFVESIQEDYFSNGSDFNGLSARQNFVKLLIEYYEDLFEV